MIWHCVADSLGMNYCEGTPEWEIEPTQYSLANGTPTTQAGGTCKLSPETCGKCRGSQQIWDEHSQEEKDRISKSSYVHKVILIEEPKAEGKKSKDKKAKKPEAEIVQGSMF